MPAHRRSPFLRSPSRLLAAAGALAAGLALSACGAPHAGTAAVVDGNRITESGVQHEVKRLRSAVGTEAKTVNLNQFTLDQMITDRVLDRALRDRHLAVSEAKVHDLHTKAAAASGGERALRARLLQNGVLPDEIDSFYRQQAGMQELVQASGADPRDQQAGQAALNKALGDTAKRMKISVNPRYGAWQVGKMRLGAADQSWLKQT